MRTESLHPCRSLWTPGPWRDEPDKVQWQCADSGLVTVLNRSYQGSWIGHVYTDGLPLPSAWHHRLPAHVRELCDMSRRVLPVPGRALHRQDDDTVSSIRAVSASMANAQTLAHQCELTFYEYFTGLTIEEWITRCLLIRHFQFTQTTALEGISLRGLKLGHALGSPNNSLYTPDTERYTPLTDCIQRAATVMRALGNLSKDHTNFDANLPPPEDLPWQP